MGSHPLRIGDAERDTAVSALGEHYAAGRLTKDEYDERADDVSAARFDADLTPLFADLPRSERTVETTEEPAIRGRGHGPPWKQRAGLMLHAAFMALMVGGLLFMVVRGAPWILLIFFWLWVFSGGFGFRHARRHHRIHSAHHHG